MRVQFKIPVHFVVKHKLCTICMGDFEIEHKSQIKKYRNNTHMRSHMQDVKRQF